VSPVIQPIVPIPLSVLDLVPLVQGKTSSDALRSSAELARAVDRLGYVRLWYAEHHNLPSITTTNPEILIAHMAPLTRRIRVGAGGVMLPNHAPLRVVESYRLLEALHPGRIDLGIGRAPGTDQMTAYALRRAREVMSAEDFPEQLAELMAYDAGDFPGDHPFSAIRAMPDDVRLPPIWLLGSSTGSCSFAADAGLGFAFAGHFSGESAEAPMRIYRSGFRPGLFKKPHAILALAVFCAETDAEAQRMASSVFVTFAQLRTGRLGRMVTPDEAARHVFTPDEEAAVASFRRIVIAGTAEVVKRRIEEAVARTGADEVMIATHAAEPAARVRSYELIARTFALPVAD
jgi:luciferase family oxidoreductase group 1